MRVINRLKYLFTAGPEIDDLIWQEQIKREAREREAIRGRLKLCITDFEHRQAPNHLQLAEQAAEEHLAEQAAEEQGGQKMDRMIRVTDCTHCPRADHRGTIGFGYPAYVPCCRATGRDLPWEPSPKSVSGRFTALRLPGIPNWCPLEPAG